MYIKSKCPIMDILASNSINDVAYIYSSLTITIYCTIRILFGLAFFL